MDFKAQFPVVSIIFRPLFFFSKVGKTVLRCMTVYWWIRVLFSCALRLYETAKCLMAILCLAKMKEKTYMFNEKDAIDKGVLATSKTLAVSNAMYLFE